MKNIVFFGEMVNIEFSFLLIEMPYCKYCGRHVHESEGTICEFCLQEESYEKEVESKKVYLPYPPLYVRPRTRNSGKSLTTVLILSTLAGAMLFFFLLGRRIL